MITIFKNPFGEIRSGWRVVLFILLFALAGTAVFIPIILRLLSATQFLVSILSLAGVVLATFVAARFLEKRKLAATGLAVNKNTMRQLGLGCLLGWLMMTAIFGIEYSLGYVKVEMPDFSFANALQAFGISTAFFAAAAMFEEMLVRGYAMQVLAQGVGVVWSSIITAVVFSVLHIANPNIGGLAFVNIVLVGIVFALAYWRTRSLWLPFGIHFSWNFAQTTLYGFPTSGQDFTRYELTKLTQFGPEWLTGGAFGPEAGAFATLMIVLCGAYLFFSYSLPSYVQQNVLEPDDRRLTAELAGRRIAA